MKRGQQGTTEEFVEMAEIHHGDKYDYSKTVYTYAKNKVTITCKRHGDFTQIARDHTHGHGCRKCRDNDNKVWSQEEDTYVKDHYQRIGAHACAKDLGKTVISVYGKAKALGVATPNKEWPYKVLCCRVWRAVVSRAELKGFAFDLSPEYIEELYAAQKAKCALTGWDIVFHHNHRTNTASIDRIDSDRGYLRGNVQLTHKRVNRCKLDNPEEYFYSMCKAIHENRKASFERKEIDWEWDVLHDTVRPRIVSVLGIPDSPLDYTNLWSEPTVISS